jgi:DNA-binding MarR family transcriptional regulator
MIEEAERDRLIEVAEDLDSVPALMLASLALAFKRMAAVVERETGVSTRKWFALSMLGKEEGISQGDMCQRVGLDPSCLTRLSQALEREGMIRRTIGWCGCT